MYRGIVLVVGVLGIRGYLGFNGVPQDMQRRAGRLPATDVHSILQVEHQPLTRFGTGGI
jgi:hypothetical protein